MACKDALKMRAAAQAAIKAEPKMTVKNEAVPRVERLRFGVDSKVQSNDLLQNNITEFEWAARNKIYPDFWGRNITGENSLTKDEISFLHRKGCKIAAIHIGSEGKKTEEQGKLEAKKAEAVATDLSIPKGKAIFLEVPADEEATRDYLKGYATGLMEAGYVPAFKANTDAAYPFDREFSRGMQTDREVFAKCLVWAVTSSLKEYDRVTTTHLIHPDEWKPYAPSGITRRDIAVWQYGKDCHPIEDDMGKETTFNVNLVRDDNVIIEKMF